MSGHQPDGLHPSQALDLYLLVLNFAVWLDVSIARAPCDSYFRGRSCTTRKNCDAVRDADIVALYDLSGSLCAQKLSVIMAYCCSCFVDHKAPLCSPWACIGLVLENQY